MAIGRDTPDYYQVSIACVNALAILKLALNQLTSIRFKANNIIFLHPSPEQSPLDSLGAPLGLKDGYEVTRFEPSAEGMRKRK